MYENQIKDIDIQLQNLVSVIASSGVFNDSIQQTITSLESRKKDIAALITQEKLTIGYLAATKNELKQVYNNAKAMLLHGNFEEQKTVLNLFLNKVLVFKKHVEIYINLIPFSLGGGIDLNIDSKDYLVTNTTNNDFDIDFTDNTEKEDEFTSSSSQFNPNIIYREKSFGSPGKI